MIYEILKEFNESNSLNYKRETLKKYSNNELLMRVFNRALDNVKWTYGITMKNVNVNNSGFNEVVLTLSEALDILENSFATRNVTGNAAIKLLEDTLATLNTDDAHIIELIIGRDLKIGVSKTEFNKVAPKEWKCIKPSYMRCDTYSPKTAKNINFPALIQIKADGTFREFTVENGKVSSRSRSGESYDYPIHFEIMKNFPDGVYIGELTVRGHKDRQVGNGLINSDNPPHEDIVLDLWDYITADEYTQAALKDRKNPCKTPYETRFSRLNDILYKGLELKNNNIRLIEYEIVTDLQSALRRTSEWMSEGYEGSILKDLSGVFKDGTSKHQLKLKLEISVEMRCVGFQEGKKGTKREGKIGSLIFENDEGTIKGRCSGFTDGELDEFTENFENYKGKILEVQFNDLSKAVGNDYYALSHPRFITWREDRDDTTTLERAFHERNMAMELGSK